MTGGRSPGDPSARRELAVVLLAGAAGAGLVLLATRQVLARVIVLAPRPLPASVTPVSGQDLRPAIAALAVAALASLAAVLATRGLVRRLTGLITVALGAGIGIQAFSQVTTAQALDAARGASDSPASGAGAGTAAGSVTAGGGTGTGGLSLSGFPVHVDLGGSSWRLMMIAGALLLAAAGIAVIARARSLPAMSARYDRPARRPAGQGSGPRSGPGRGSGRQPGQSSGQRPAAAAVGPGMWESLSAGDDPTTWPDTGPPGPA